METSSFFTEFFYKNKLVLAEVKPCCKENNLYYYDISIKNQYQFTVSPSFEREGINWKVSFKNADKQVDPALIDIIGNEIENRVFQLT